MKKISIFVFCGMLAASAAQAQTAAPATVAVLPSAAEKVAVVPAGVPTVITYSSSGKAGGNPQNAESELYHRKQPEPCCDERPILAVGAGAAAGALIWDSGYRHGRRRYRRHRNHW